MFADTAHPVPSFATPQPPHAILGTVEPGPTPTPTNPAFVAQGIEHRSPKAGVAGSNPAEGTRISAGQVTLGGRTGRHPVPTEKAPILDDKGLLTANAVYPMPWRLGCDPLRVEQDQRGRQIITIELQAGASDTFPFERSGGSGPGRGLQFRP